MSDLRISSLALLLFALPIASPTANAQETKDAPTPSAASTANDRCIARSPLNNTAIQ